MNSRDLVINAIQRKPIERVPWVPFVGVHGAALLGTDAKTYLYSPEMIFQGAKLAVEKYHADGLPVTFDLQIEPECLGCELKWNDKNPPAVVTHPLTAGVKLEDLKVPGPDDGRIPIVMEAARKIRKEFPDIALYGLVAGPFTLALHLLGTEVFMKMFDSPEYVYSVLEFCSQVTMAMTDYYCDAGCDIIAVVDPMTSQIGEDQFRQFVTKPATIVFDHIRAKGKYSSFFVCGHAQHNIKAMCECGPDNISVDENVPLDYVRDIAKAHNISMGGNLKLTVVLLFGDQVDSQQNAMRCIQQSEGEGFILSPGCDLPFDTPPENLAVVGNLVRDPYQQQVVLSMAAHAEDDDLPDLSNYGTDGPVQIDIITLDSESCPPCQYMVEAVQRIIPEFHGKAEWREHPIKEPAAVKFMKALGVKNIPTICIDSKPAFVSIIPKRDELMQAIQDRIDEKKV